MYALFVTVLYALAILASTEEGSVERECCKKIKGFKDCKRECVKVWVEKKPVKRLQLALSLPRVCPSHLDYLWKCFNSSIKGLHHYMNFDSHLNGKSCCLLSIGTSCRKACFLARSAKDLQQRCTKTEEQRSLRGCIERSQATEKCCKASTRKCTKACQIVFSSDKEPSRKKIRAVRRKCGSNDPQVLKCVNDLTGPKTNSLASHRCCRMTHIKKCQDVCREVMSSKNMDRNKKMNLLKNNCKEHQFAHKMWSCFLENVPLTRPNIHEQNPDIRLHCCSRAKTEECSSLCFQRYSKGSDANQRFTRSCVFNPKETTMLTCIADVSTPCHIGCSGLKFCTNFNHRHTELFRGCSKESDIAAKYDFDNWWKEGRVKIPAMDVIPVKNIKKCLPDVWKAIACVLQIRPCHAKSHGSAICRKDCIKVLNECAKKQQLGVRTVETICKSLSPDENSSCISLERYIKPSLYKKETAEVTHPCYPNPCKPKDVCEINRELSGKKPKVPYRCMPGCPVDQHSKLLVRDGDFARLPMVANSKSERCFKICRCDQERLSDCPRLPDCVQRNSCDLQGSKESYKHQEKFYINCNFCVCFDGKVICSRKQCFPGVGYNGTDRPRRNHSPKNGKNEFTVTGLPCHCSGVYSPVCGANGKTYRNFCFARCAQLKPDQISQGRCSSVNPCSPSPCQKTEFCAIDRKICIGTTSFCPQYICVRRPQECSNATMERFCDAKNKQHFSKCSLHKTGEEIAYRGNCMDSCAPGIRQVCGVDGKTYSSICAMNHARMLMDYEGPCKTVGKYTSEDPTVRCAYVKCPDLKPSNCVGITPPGACCKVCATQLSVLFSEDEILKTNNIVMQPITQEQVVSRVRRYLSVSECDLFGFYNTYADFVLLVKVITENPTILQFVICNKEAQKIETLVHTASPWFTSDGILSSFRAISLTTPQLSKPNAAILTRDFSGLLLLFSFLVSFVQFSSS